MIDPLYTDPVSIALMLLLAGLVALGAWILLNERKD